MTCAVCSAPALPVDGVCAFCRSPVERPGDGSGLLDYVVAHVPGVKFRRNLVRRGPVRRLAVTADGVRFTGRLRKGELELAPEVEPAAWAASLVAALARDAAADHELRAALSRSGWALTQPR